LPGLQPIDGNIGEHVLKVIFHEVFGFVFGICFCAGPAAEIHLCSGSFNVEGSAAKEAFFLYVLQDLYPLSFIFLTIK